MYTMYQSVLMGNVKSQSLKRTSAEHALLFATSRGKRSTVAMAMKSEVHTTNFGNHACNRSSGCWKAVKIYKVTAAIISATTTAITIRARFGPAILAIGLGAYFNGTTYRAHKSTVCPSPTMYILLTE